MIHASRNTLYTMTSSNGNIFRVTGFEWGIQRSQRPVTWGFDVFFDLGLHKRLSKQSRRRSFETPMHSLWHHCNESGLYPRERRPADQHQLDIDPTRKCRIDVDPMSIRWPLLSGEMCLINIWTSTNMPGNVAHTWHEIDSFYKLHDIHSKNLITRLCFCYCARISTRLSSLSSASFT